MKTWGITQRIKYIIRTESSVPMASDMGLELHHSTMTMLLGKGYRYKIEKKEIY